MTTLHQTPLPLSGGLVERDAAAAVRIDWLQPAVQIEAFVRSLEGARQAAGGYQHVAPRPSAMARIGGVVVGVATARVGGTMSSYPAGTITRCDDEVWVQTGRGHLAIDRVIVDGEEREAAEYFVAAGFVPGDTFETTPTTPGTPREFSRAA